MPYIKLSEERPLFFPCADSRRTFSAWWSFNVSSEGILEDDPPIIAERKGRWADGEAESGIMVKAS